MVSRRAPGNFASPTATHVTEETSSFWPSARRGTAKSSAKEEWPANIT